MKKRPYLAYDKYGDPIDVKVARSAVTGRFVKMWMAIRYPRSTIVQIVRKLRRKK